MITSGKKWEGTVSASTSISVWLEMLSASNMSSVIPADELALSATESVPAADDPSDRAGVF